MTAQRENSVRRKIIYFVGRDSYFVSHRLPTARAAQAAGYEVHVIAANSGLVAEIEQQDMHFHDRWMAEDKVPALSLIAGVLQVFIKSLTLRASVVQVVGLRYALVGLPASLFLPWTRFIFSINGLGFLFAKSKPKFIYRLARKIILSIFTIIATLRKIEITFQNADDLEHFVGATTLRQAKIHLIRGSGVDTKRYQPIPFPSQGPVTFGLASRMIRMKGVSDIIKAFEELIDEGRPVKLILAGDIDETNPDSLTRDEIQSHCSNDKIEWLGYLDDVTNLWEKSHVAMLGSHGGEGLPMALLIPAAMARPIICSDASGNRDLVRDGENGYIFPAGDTKAIKDAVQKILNQDLEEMGKASLKLIHDKKMDGNSVHDQFIELYRV